MKKKAAFLLTFLELRASSARRAAARLAMGGLRPPPPPRIWGRGRAFFRKTYSATGGGHPPLVAS